MNDIPSAKVQREFEAVARRAQEFASAIGSANRLPDDFPKDQVKDICKSLAHLPFGTSVGGREQLTYANSRLPDVRGKYFKHDVNPDDGQPARDEQLDEHFALLIAAVATAISTIDRENGKRPANDILAVRYDIDPNNFLTSDTINLSHIASESLERIHNSVELVTKPNSKNVDRLRRWISDGRNLIRMAQADLQFRDFVPQHTTILRIAIEKIPLGLRVAADAIDVTVDIVEPHLKQWSEVKRDLREGTIKHIRKFAENLRKNAERFGSNKSIRHEQKNVPPTDLTLREMKILKWISFGKTAEETAIILSLSASTVKRDLLSIRRKLNTNTTSQAVAHAARLDII